MSIFLLFAVVLFLVSCLYYHLKRVMGGDRLLWLATAMLLGEYVHLFRDWGLL